MAALIADCDTFRSAAASETLPALAVAMKYRIWRNEITVLSIISCQLFYSTITVGAGETLPEQGNRI